MERATDNTDYLSTPASKDSEESLLGSILMEPTLLAAEVISRVEPKDFQTRKYGWVWEAFLALQSNGTAIDQLTVQEYLERQSHLEEVGGFSELIRLTTVVPTPYHAPDYASTVIEMAERRLMKRYAQRLSVRADELDRPLDESILPAIEALQKTRALVKPLSLQRFRVYSAADALAPREPMAYVIERLLTAGSVSLLVGDGGSGKTFALLDMAVCVAIGKDWLDFETNQTPVLVVDEESGRARMAERLSRTLEGHFGDEETPVFYVSLANTNLYEPDDANMLHLTIKKHGAGLVIIDALADVMPGGDENAVRDVQPVFIQLRKIADDTNAAIIVIHHSNKAGGFRGSTAMKGAVDLMLLMEAEDGLLSFRSEKARDIEPITFGARTNHIDSRFYLSSSELKPKPIAVVKSEKHVLQHLEAYGDSDTTEIMTTAEICSGNAARQAVYRLVDEGLVHRKNDGGKGKVAIYGLTERGEEVVESKL